MNKSELGNRVADFLFGQKIEGVVSAVLPIQIDFSQRYAVSTKDGVVDTHISAVTKLIFPVPIYFPRRPLKRGEKIEERAVRVRPWIDGRIV